MTELIFGFLAGVLFTAFISLCAIFFYMEVSK